MRSTPSVKLAFVPSSVTFPRDDHPVADSVRWWCIIILGTDLTRNVSGGRTWEWLSRHTWLGWLNASHIRLFRPLIGMLPMEKRYSLLPGPITHLGWFMKSLRWSALHNQAFLSLPRNIECMEQSDTKTPQEGFLFVPYSTNVFK